MLVQCNNALIGTSPNSRIECVYTETGIPVFRTSCLETISQDDVQPKLEGDTDSTSSCEWGNKHSSDDSWGCMTSNTSKYCYFREMGILS